MDDRMVPRLFTTEHRQRYSARRGHHPGDPKALLSRQWQAALSLVPDSSSNESPERGHARRGTDPTFRNPGMARCESSRSWRSFCEERRVVRDTGALVTTDGPETGDEPPKAHRNCDWLLGVPTRLRASWDMNKPRPSFVGLGLNKSYMVQGEGFEPPKANANRFTVCRV